LADFIVDAIAGGARALIGRAVRNIVAHADGRP
jgi:hypothetical protein